jgi:hypothetical protein
VSQRQRRSRRRRRGRRWRRTKRRGQLCLFGWRQREIMKLARKIAFRRMTGCSCEGKSLEVYERDRETERQRQRDRDREKEKQTDRQTDSRQTDKRRDRSREGQCKSKGVVATLY